MKMEMESLHNSSQAETAEPEPPSQPASYRDEQVWKDIEAETGFASYEAYLEYYKDAHPDFETKLFELRHNETRFGHISSRWTNTVIYDLSVQENSSTKLSLRCHCKSGTELINDLRKPPDGVCVQLVFWHRNKIPHCQEMVDTLGLGLRLDLDDFDYRGRWTPPPRKSDPRIKSIFGEQTVAAISQGFMCDVAREVPVVLVASSYQGPWDRGGSNSFADYCETPPFCKASRKIMPFERAQGGSLQESASLNYTLVVKNFIVQDRDVQPTKQSLLLAAISPLLYAEVTRMTDHINRIHKVYTIVVFKSRDSRFSQEDLATDRTELRRITEMSEDILAQFSRYIGSEGPSDISNQPSYVSVVANLRSLIADARRLEAEVRDFKQIQIGDLALKESYKSIELSNAQIREAKSGKFPNHICVDYTHVSQ